MGKIVRLMTAGRIRSRLEAIARQRRDLEKKIDRLDKIEQRYRREAVRLDQIEFQFGEDRIYG